MQYREFLDLIYQKYSGNIKLGLERMQGLLSDLGNPQESQRGFHIGGTNGKGSVCAALEALCLSLEGGVGLNTSPHLIDYTERFRIDGRELDFATILDTYLAHEDLFNKWDASFFEITTALAIILFAQRGLSHSIMEVGLGGRLDATNLWHPDLCAITSIGLDHIKTLGGTEELIAVEKAGILKSGIPLVLGPVNASPRQIILDRAEELGCPLYLAGRDFSAENVRLTTDATIWDYHGPGLSLKNLSSNMSGLHQAQNLSIALTAWLIYMQKRDLPYSEEQIRTALKHVNWAGRMQLVRSHPTVIVDGAHNVQGITALTESLARIYPGKKISFVLSILADKNYSEMIRLICNLADKIYIAQNSSDRAATVQEQAQAVALHTPNYQECGSVVQAYSSALEEAGDEDIIVGGGSLYTVGEILTAERQRADKQA